MRILLWHGYLLGGTGSNVYTRALAREWSRAGHDVTSSARSASPELRPRRRAGRPPELPGGCCRRSCSTATRVSSLGCCRTARGRSGSVRRRRTPRPSASPSPPISSSRTTCCSAAPVGVAGGVPFRVKAHGSELEYSMRGRPELERWGREALARADATFVGSEHIRRVLDEVVGHVDRVDEVPPGVDVDQFTLQERRAALADLLDEARADPPNPGNAEERLPTTATRRGWVVPRRRRAHRRLLREADRAEGRAGAAGGDAADRRPAGRRRLRPVPPRARGRGGRADALHRPARAPPPRASAAAGRRRPSCRRCSRRRSAWSRPRPPRPARRRSSPATPGSPRSRPGSRSATREHLRLASFATGDADDLARKLNELIALPAAEREALRRPRAGRRRALVVGERRRAAARAAPSII